MNSDITAYKIINGAWSHKTDSRRTPYMYHIDMGIRYLRHIRADDDTVAAWCLHPLVQSYKDLSENLPILALHPELTKALAVAIEYRNQANRYSTHKEFSSKISNPEYILPEVTQMLQADKLQNYWNLTRNRKEHPNYENLVNYFHDWFSALDIETATINKWNKQFDNMI